MILREACMAYEYVTIWYRSKDLELHKHMNNIENDSSE